MIWLHFLLFLSLMSITVPMRLIGARPSRITGIALALVVLLCGVIAPATAQTPPHGRMDIEAMNRELGLIESQLERQVQHDTILTRLRGRLEPIAREAQAILERELPRLDGINARLSQIGPKPDDKAPAESAEVKRARDEQDAQKKEADELIRVARLLLVRHDQLQIVIADQRRTLFRQATLQRTQSIISPQLWVNVVQAVPAAISSFFASVDFRARQLANNLEINRLIGALLVIVLSMISTIPVARLSRRWLAQTYASTSPTRTRKAVAALRSVGIKMLIPAILGLATILVLDLLDFHNDRYGVLVRHIITALLALVVLRSLVTAILSPGAPLWRLLNLSDATAQSLSWAGLAILVIGSVGKILEAANQAISAALPFTVAARGMTAVLIATILLVTIRRLSDARQKRVLDEDSTDHPEADLMVLRLGSGIIAVALLVSALSGYVALASFLADQVIWVLLISALIHLFGILIDECIGRGLVADHERTRRVTSFTGLGTGAVKQIGILVSGVLKLVIYVAGLFLLLAPFGVDSGDMFGSIRAAFFGFQLGGITISLSGIAFALALFLLGAFATRSIQSWLDKVFLPNTTMDVGLRNSITTILGYTGYFTSALLALSHLGLGLEKVTIVAGALSLGIGFGLQSIVGNFVSGLILLWERPIRVGDWIVVGEEQGKVKRINVRATQIETFDRASLIVPNSEFISGRVKNYMHANRSTRIIIPIGVSYDSDPEAVRKLLLDAALAHLEILSDPAPIVLFIGLGDFSLNFELRCFVDVDAVASTRSELMFDIFRRLKAQRIDVPFPRRTVDIADMDGLGKAIASNMPHSAGKD